MNNKGFISMAVVYSFLIVFVLIMLSLLTAYAYRNQLLNNQINEVKDSLNREYQE